MSDDGESIRRRTPQLLRFFAEMETSENSVRDILLRRAMY